VNRPLLALILFLIAGACAHTTSWRPIPKPWTADVIDVQRRVRVVLDDGTSHEVERPLYEPEGAPVLAWRGDGPSALFPARAIPLERVENLQGVVAGDPGMGGTKVAQASLVVIGVVLWGLLLVAIFS
jgi:hypothetical protein